MTGCLSFNVFPNQVVRNKTMNYGHLLIAIFVMTPLMSQCFVLQPGLSIAASSDEKASLKTNSTLFEGEVLPKTILLDPYELVKLKQAVMKQNDSVAQNFVKSIVAEADSVLAKKPISVTEKTEFPPNGTKHDFFALARYEWPNPNTANGLPYISRDGYTNPETLLIKDKEYIREMVQRVMILAFASYLTDNPKYNLKAQELLNVWFLQKDTFMSPNLRYGQYERGNDELNPSGIMDAHDLPYLLDAIGMLELSPHWSKTVKIGLEQWFTKYLDWLLTSDLGKREGQRANNHGTYYTVQVSAIAYFLNKTDITQKLLKSTMQDLGTAPFQDVPRLIAVKINPDGTQPFEIQRANSLHYHLYNLYGVALLARIGDRTGVDIWNYEIHGVGMRKALDFIIPYALGQQRWPYGQVEPLDNNALLYLQGILCQAILHYNNNQSYLQVYRSLQTKNLPIDPQDILCDLQTKYTDTGS